MNLHSLEIIKNNINLAREASCRDQSLKMVVVVSGSHADCENWQSRLEATRTVLFNTDTAVLSLEEKIGNKTREGNFLGTLLAYRRIQAYARQHNLPYRDFVTLAGMIFGRGERISPFTQIEGNRKPAIIVNTGFQRGNRRIPLTAIEESLIYFVPVGRYLEQGGFRGILDKWGDETEIPSIDLSIEQALDDEFADYDIIKFVSVLTISDELARQKDWVVFDDDGNMLTQLCRNSRENLISQLRGLGVKQAEDGTFSAGISLGPVAVSYAVLDIADRVFADEIIREGVFFDFDPYFMMAICMPDDPPAWQALVTGNPDLRELIKMIPDFFLKVQSIKKIFCQQYKRPLNIKAFNLGSEIYWADIGQHRAMAEKYFSLLEDSFRGEIARYLEHIAGVRDKNNNLIINAEISPGITVRDSVIINSCLTGQGSVTSSLVKESHLHNPSLQGAFAVLSHRPGGRLTMQEGSGLYRSIGNGDLALEPGCRSGTLLMEKEAIELKVCEDTDLRQRAINYNRALPGNEFSFLEAYNRMEGVSMDELEKRRRELISSLEKVE